MVYYSKQADDGLDDILEGLLTWRKCILTREFCLNYISNIVDVCDSLDTEIVHLNTF